MMPEEKYLRLDDLAVPAGYVAPSTSEDLAYITYFRIYGYVPVTRARTI